jgi:ferritin-like protein
MVIRVRSLEHAGPERPESSRGDVLAAGLPRLAAAAPSPEQDGMIANFALRLEYLQAAFYEAAFSQANLTGDLLEFVEVVREHEQAHVDYLKELLGDAAEPSPRFDFGNSVRNANNFAKAATTLEDLGVAAYNGQATNLTPKTLAAAARIISVDARHAAWIRAIVGRPPALQPTDKPKTANRVLQDLDKIGFIRS